ADHLSLRNQFDRSLQRRAPFPEIPPHIADPLHAFEDVPYCERGGLDLTALDLLPRAGRRHGRAAARPCGVSRSKRRVIAVSAGIDIDAPASIDLVELLR